MVQLVGVVHGQSFGTSFSEHVMHTGDQPHFMLINRLEKLPTGSRIGIEKLSPEDEEMVTQDWKFLSTQFDGDGYFVGDRYFQKIEEKCLELGHEVVYLEEKKHWLTHNQERINLEKFVGTSVSQDRMDQRQKTFFEHSEKQYLIQTNIEKIHRIDRDETLLKNIAHEHLDQAIVGIGHTDPWMYNLSFIENMYGITFTTYSTDDRKLGGGNFYEHAKPNAQRVFDTTCFTRRLKMLADPFIGFNLGAPDFVGTCRMDMPSVGYFEMYIDRHEGQDFSGTMVQVYGDAEIEGKLHDGQMNFRKKYIRCGSEAIQANMYFNSTHSDGNSFVGSFRDENRRVGGHFIAESFSGKIPLELAMSWYELSQKG